jgi:site-specific recombinase XerD
VEYAVDAFLRLAGASGRNTGKSTLNAFSVLLRLRLLPFSESRTLKQIQSYQNLDVTTNFFTSWVNLQPTRNRKNVSMPSEPKPLADPTKKAELERLRQFYRFCIDRKWMDSNPAMKIKVSTKTAKKFGMEPNEEAEFFKAVEEAGGGHGRSDEANAQELRAFCKAMRGAGLRISDTITLNVLS